MAGDVDKVGAVGNDLNALGHQTIYDRAHGFLVARDRARGKNNAVALVQRYLRMIVIGDARQRRARFALASRAQCQHLVAREMAIEIGAAKILHLIEIAGLARDLHHPLHGASDHHDLAPSRPRRVRDSA